MNLGNSSSVFPWKSRMEQSESPPVLPPTQNNNQNQSTATATATANYTDSDLDNSNSISPSRAELLECELPEPIVTVDHDIENSNISSSNPNPNQGAEVCECRELENRNNGNGNENENCESQTLAALALSPCPSPSPSSGPTYKDMATWTVEDDMPSPLDAYSPSDSPVLSGLGLERGRHSRDARDFYPGFDERDEYPDAPHFLPEDLPLPQAPGGGCFTVSSQLQTREARLYENVPTTQSELQTLGMMLFQGHSSSELIHPGSYLEDNLPGQHRYASRQNTPGSGRGGGDVNFRNVNDYLGLGAGGGGSSSTGGGPPSRSSWVDSGRESLSFDGESGNTANNSNSNGSSKNLMLIPPPISHMNLSGSSGNINMDRDRDRGSGSSRNERHSNTNGNPGDYSPSNSFLKGRKGGGKNNMSRKERLVRQKHAIEDNFQPYPSSATTTGYLAVPSPRRGGDQHHHHHHHHLISPGAVGISSPISLQRHPNSQQMMLQENKKSRGLIPGCESPYGTGGGLSCGGLSEYANRQLRMQSSRSPSRAVSGIGGGGAGSRRHGHSSNHGGQSFDYGELPSHQMFPNLKRHLLSGRQFSHPYGDPSSNGGGTNNNLNSAFLPSHLQAQHRSFPAGLLSGVAPRSCSMGDLTSGASPGSIKGKPTEHQTIPISSATNPPGGLSSNLPIVTSLPLPPATSVTYEFSLAPVSGTLAPGWHLTAVQRGLATAVPLAAVVARRRIPRPRSSRPRFGFTDKSEARRAKWTIAVTALALLAMSMLLVGVTLRLAPLIDDLVRKENEDLLRGVIHQPPSTLNNNISLSTSTPNSLLDIVENGQLSRSSSVLSTGESVVIPVPAISSYDLRNSNPNSNSTVVVSSPPLPLTAILLGDRDRGNRK